MLAPSSSTVNTNTKVLPDENDDGDYDDDDGKACPDTSPRRKGTHQLRQRCRRKTLGCRKRAPVLSKPVYMFCCFLLLLYFAYLFYFYFCFFVCFYTYPTELLGECHLLIWLFHLNVNEEENENCHSCNKKLVQTSWHSLGMQSLQSWCIFELAFFFIKQIL